MYLLALSAASTFSAANSLSLFHTNLHKNQVQADQQQRILTRCVQTKLTATVAAANLPPAANHKIPPLVLSGEQAEGKCFV